MKAPQTLVVMFEVSELDEPAFHKLLDMLLSGPMAAHKGAKYNLIDVSQEEMSSHIDKLIKET